MNPGRIRSSCRPPTLLDLLVVIAATAVGLAAIRLLGGGRFLNPLDAKSLAQGLERIGRLGFEGAPLLGSWTAALLILHLLRPRPTLRRISRRPGFVACLAVLACSLLECIPIMILARVGEAAHYSVFFISGPGWAVGAAWSSLLVGGRWRSERNWLDRGGRVLGTLWLVFPPIALAFILMD